MFCINISVVGWDLLKVRRFFFVSIFQLWVEISATYSNWFVWIFQLWVEVSPIYGNYFVWIFQLWVGTKGATIHIINTDTRKVIKDLQAHDDAVRALCCAENRYIISGAGSRDGRIAMWSSTDTKTDSGRFLLDKTWIWIGIKESSIYRSQLISDSLIIVKWSWIMDGVWEFY